MLVMRPLIVVEGPAGAARGSVAESLEAVRRGGWHVIRGWAAPMRRDRVVCTGTIATADDARRALLAAVSGAGLVVATRADRETTDRFLDDLRRLGKVEHVTAIQSGGPVISHEQRALLGLLGEGLTLGEAAAELGLARGTAGRRVSAARRALGVDTTAEAILAASAESR
jgi:DNA-binding NarL/FixJ family response regulator